MDKQQMMEQIMVVVNTIGSTMLRIDQVEAHQRLSACMGVLRNVVAEMQKVEPKEPVEREG